MDRPHWHLDREAGEECQPQPGLRADREIICHQRGDIGRADLVHHPQHGDQHQHRSEQRVEEELIGGVDPVLPAPYADDQVHRDQAGFEEYVEKEQILRAEDADHQRFHEQERRHVLANPLLNRVPACKDADRHQEHAEHDQQQGDTIDAERIAENREDLRALGKLPLRSANIEIDPEQDTQCQVGQRRDKRDDARLLGADHEAGDCRQKRNRQHYRQDRETVHQKRTHVMAATSPISMTSA